MIEIRRNTDLQSLLRWRREVMSAVFGVAPSAELMRANEEYYRRHIADDSHIAYVASRKGVDIGCGAVCLTDELPSPDNHSGKCAYLMNIYIRPMFRRHGYAHLLVQKLVETAKETGCGKIYLESTDLARSLYRATGFEEMGNMMKYETGF